MEVGGKEMKTIQTIAKVLPDGTLIVQVSSRLTPGEHLVILVVDDRPAPLKRQPLAFPVDHYGPWPGELSLRREDLYDDWGR